MAEFSLLAPSLSCFKRNPRAGLRLFCFPYAGGGASIYSKWAGSLPDTVEIQCAQLPGRETRMFDSPFQRLQPLVEALAPIITPYVEQPYAFFGHSMGALIGFELCRQLRKLGKPLPVSLFVAGRRAPHLPNEEPPIYDLPHEAFLHELHQLNGTPKAILENEELMEMAIPGLRADFEICETYEYVPGPPLPLPILAFGGLFDPEVSRQEVDAWRQHTSDQFSLSMLPGDHFFIESARPQLLHRLSQELFRLQPTRR